MNVDAFVHLSREALMLVLLLSAPAAIAAMVVGLIVGILQAATQVQEQTLTAVPKIAMVFIVLMVAGLWMLDLLVNFTDDLLELIVAVGRGG